MLHKAVSPIIISGTNQIENEQDCILNFVEFPRFLLIIIQKYSA